MVNRNVRVYLDNRAARTRHGIRTLLLHERHYKTLSLFLADNAGVPVPPTVLILGPECASLGLAINGWKRPVIIRLDYRIRPMKKFLGGVPVSSLSILRGLVRFLDANGCSTLVHPNFDRFRNIYSAGLLFVQGEPNVRMELVGQGFDASDLRLGFVSPHETIELHLPSGTISNRKLLQRRTYLQSRKDRAAKIAALRGYTRLVNKTITLSDKLTSVGAGHAAMRDAYRYIPDHYIPIPSGTLQGLVGIATVVNSKVLSCLPASAVYAASLSYFDNRGWVLWDIYGTWYER